MIKQCFIDLETTGLSPKQHGILEIGGLIEYLDVSETFNLQAQPFPGDDIDVRALEVNNLTLKDIKKFPPPRDTYEKLIITLSAHIDRYNRKDKLFFIAYNANFDSQFLREFFKKMDDEYYGSWFWHPPIDVMTMSAIRFMNVRHTMKDFHLSTVAAKAGVEVDPDKTHTAMYDVMLMRALFNQNMSHFM